MAAYQNSTYYFASSNLMTQPECSAVCAPFQPAAATSEEPQHVSSAQIFGQSWTNDRVRGWTASFAKRELFRAPQRMFYQLELTVVQRLARMSYILLAILHGACILNNRYVGKE